MKKSMYLIVLLLLFSIVLVSFPQIKVVTAEPKTIVVPDDYAAISWAIGNASEGDTIYVKKGTYYNQSLIVTKAMSLIGEDAETTILRGLDVVWPVAQSSSMMDGIEYEIQTVVQPNINSQSSNVQLLALDKSTNLELSLCNFLPPITIVIQVEANDVTISGFTITNAFTGITGNANGTKIINNIITASNNGMSIGGSHKIISGNIIRGGLTGIQCSGYYNNITGNILRGTSNQGIDLHGTHNHVVGNSITNYGSVGMTMQNADYNTISNNTITDGNEGLIIGFYGKNCSHNIISGNRIERLALWGILMGAGSHNMLYENYVANVQGSHDGYAVAIGGNHLVAEENRFYRNNFVNNSKSVGYNWVLEGTGNFWDNGEEGNYWSDYTGVDANHDGIGDTPYIINENNQDNHPLMQPTVIPEFPAWIILPLLITATLLILIYKQRLPKNTKTNRNHSY
jgi:parallel beta-helix repeat protein